MKKYRCTKVVEAARIQELYSNTLILDDGEEVLLPGILKTKLYRMAEEAGLNVEDGYYLKYDGGYVSWSPADVFEDDYYELVDPTPEERLYQNVEVYLRAAIVSLAEIEGSNLEVLSNFARAIDNMNYAVKEKAMYSKTKAVEVE